MSGDVSSVKAGRDDDFLHPRNAGGVGEKEGVNAATSNNSERVRRFHTQRHL